MAVRDWQKDTRTQVKDQERQLTDLEKQMLKEQWIKEEE